MSRYRQLDGSLVASARLAHPSVRVHGISLYSHGIRGHRSLLLSLGGCLILTLLKDPTRFIDLGGEVNLVRQQLLVVNRRLIENHASDSRSLFGTKRGEDRAVDVVSDEVLALLALEEVERLGIDGRQLQIISHLAGSLLLALVRLRHLLLPVALVLHLIAAGLLTLTVVVATASAGVLTSTTTASVILVITSATAALASTTTALIVAAATSVATTTTARITALALVTMLILLLHLTVRGLVASTTTHVLTLHHSGSGLPLRQLALTLVAATGLLTNKRSALCVIHLFDEVDQLLDLVLRLLVFLFLQVLLGLPEVDLESLVVQAERS